MKKYKDRKSKAVNTGFNIAFLTTAIATGLKVADLREINNAAVQQFHLGQIENAEMLNIMQSVADKEKTVGLIFLAIMGSLFVANAVYNYCQEGNEK